MKKKTDEEFGILITREMKSMMFDSNLSYEARAKIFCAIVGDEKIGDVMMDAFASSLKVGYNSTNNKRKAEILSRRERQKTYQRNLRTSTEMSVDRHSSTELSGDERASLNRAKQSKVDNIPLNPPSGVEGRIPDAISADDILAMSADGDVKVAAGKLADEIENTEAFGHMMVNRGKLMKCLVSVLKKNGAAGEKILDGLKAWTASWKADDWAYVPGRITDWLYDRKYLEAPRARKGDVSVGAGCGECGVEIG